MPTPIAENYLKALLSLSQKNKDVTVSQLSDLMEVSIPTSHSMVKKLHAAGMVLYEKYKPIRLSEKGKKSAALIVRKHRLIEMFLVDRMNFGWEEVHDIAEQIEHVDSPIFFDRMDEMLGFPQIDPHGSPIPDREGRWKVMDSKPLSECRPGQCVVLVALSDSSRELLHFLNKRQLSLGSELMIESIESYDGSMAVRFGIQGKTIFSREVCNHLLVTLK